MALFWGEKTKEQLERSRRQLVFDLEEVNMKLKQRLASAARLFITIFMYSSPQHSHPPREVDRLQAQKRKLEFQLQEVKEELE